jgi:hypothetical protein
MRLPKLREFADRTGQVFDLVDGEQRHAFTLENFHELTRWRADSEAFRLGWRGPAEPVLPQAIYRLEREGESWDMFIVPIAQDDRGTQYEAIFN